MTQHITTIDPGPDSSGHWSWHCTAEGCHEDGSGYELAAEVIAAAEAHGPLAADSERPYDFEVCPEVDPFDTPEEAWKWIDNNPRGHDQRAARRTTHTTTEALSR